LEIYIFFKDCDFDEPPPFLKSFLFDDRPFKRTFRLSLDISWVVLGWKKSV
jgi:hypothetical protein